ncbi:MAG: YggS family pyridoxal phosphate-dependent enzyme [Dehalococcoidia bacterium]|nr:MAG: YggS family pyridoxal phosphate-dependent enzyme [Dehalococcoidia bacterium]UCG84170.1 MAG: YggS family pyridoxal phosphate-dependent enzyme [Dehalococcoidia bacterium]
MGIEQNVRLIEERISGACERAGRSPDEVTLVAVTKTIEAPVIEAAFRTGIVNFGENKVQEALPKIEQLKNLKPRLTWHMVGHLQTNKAKTAVDIFDIIHSVDSLRLAEELSRRSRRDLSVLIEVNVAGEETKSGFSTDEVNEAIKQVARLPNIVIEGLMTIAPWGEDAEQVRPVFRRLRQMGGALGLKHLSMGMTDDFEVAIEEGATIVRIGRAIFGERRPG